MDKTKIQLAKREIRENTRELLGAVRLIQAMLEIESPGMGDMLIDILIEDLGKMRSPGIAAVAPRKAMISQPMAGKTDKEIASARESAGAALMGRGYTVINTLFTDDWYSQENMEKRGVVQVPLCFLAKSMENMSLCHVAYFCKGWENARGCRIEHAAAEAYGLEILYEE